jgi:hypothetical protein
LGHDVGYRLVMGKLIGSSHGAGNAALSLVSVRVGML